MTVYACIMTLLVGMLIGHLATVYLAIYMDERKRETQRRKSIHPSGRVGPNPFTNSNN